MKELVEGIIHKKLEGSHLFLTDLSVKPRRIEVFLDGDAGVNVQECAEMNRYLHNQLEENNIDTTTIHIDVSSPGIDRDLKMVREYKKNVGRNLQIRNRQGKILKGSLVYADNDKIMLALGGKQKKTEIFDYSTIQEAKVVI